MTEEDRTPGFPPDDSGDQLTVESFETKGNDAGHRTANRAPRKHHRAHSREPEATTGHDNTVAASTAPAGFSVPISSRDEVFRSFWHFGS